MAAPLPIALPPEVVADAGDEAAEEVAEPDATSQGSDEAAGSPEQPGRSPLVVAAVVAVVLALATSALLAVGAARVAHYNGVKSARRDALVAAKTETAATLTYDYRHLAADEAAAERGLTDRFRGQYARTMATEVQPLAAKNHAVTTATIPAAGVISASPTRVTVLLYSYQVVQNSLIKTTSRLDQTEIRVYMVKQGGRWLINSLKPF